MYALLKNDDRCGIMRWRDVRAFHQPGRRVEGSETCRSDNVEMCAE